MFRSKISRFVAVVLLALSYVGAYAQTSNLAPSLDGYMNGTRMWPVDAWTAPQWNTGINRVASFTDGALHLQSASALSGGAKSTAPKAYPIKPKWTAHETLSSGTYLAAWTVTMTCPAGGEKATDQAVQMDIGPLKTLTHYSLLSNGVPRDFAQVFSYSRVYANEVTYFTFGLNANPPKDAYGNVRYGCKYSLTNLSLTAQ